MSAKKSSDTVHMRGESANLLLKSMCGKATIEDKTVLFIYLAIDGGDPESALEALSEYCAMKAKP